MKKFLLILMFVCAFSFVGLGCKKVTDTDIITNSEDEAESAAQEAAAERDKLIKACKARTFNIKQQYCGVQIPAKYCKCAFHNEAAYCSQIGMNQASANEYVNNGFNAWVSSQKQKCIEAIK